MLICYLMQLALPVLSVAFLAHVVANKPLILLPGKQHGWSAIIGGVSFESVCVWCVPTQSVERSESSSFIAALPLLLPGLNLGRWHR